MKRDISLDELISVYGGSGGYSGGTMGGYYDSYTGNADADNAINQLGDSNWYTGYVTARQNGYSHEQAVYAGRQYEVMIEVAYVNEHY